MCFSKPKMEKPKASQPSFQTDVNDKEVLDEKERQRKRQRVAVGRNSTLLTSGGESGASGSANTSNKTLLGQ